MSRTRIERLFVGVGAQKTGTTWLAQVLERHPEIFMTPVKEIHYFDHIAGITEHLSRRRRRSRWRKYHQRLLTQWTRWPVLAPQRAWYRRYMRDPIGDEWYASLFAERQGRAVAGEITPEYAIIGRAGFAHLLRLAPDARLIYILRDPVARAWSQLLHQCRKRGLDAATLPGAAAMAMLAEARFVELGDYCRTLDDLAATIPDKQLLVLFYEDIHRNRLAAVQGIADFLGVSRAPEHFSGLNARPNKSQDAPLPAALREHLVAHSRGLVRDVEARMGRVPPEWHASVAG